MLKSETSPLNKELGRIIKNENYLGLTSIIAKMIRSLVSFNV